MRRHSYIGLIIFCLSTSPLAGQTPLFRDPQPWQRGAHDLAGDLSSTIYLPQQQRCNTLALGIIAATTLGGILLYHYVDDANPDQVIISQNQTYGDLLNALYLSAYASPLLFWVSGSLLPSQRTQHWWIAEELLESYMLMVPSVYLLKISTKRTSPSGSSDDAFPSGHSAASFTAATILAYHYPWYVGLTAYGLASLIAIQRFDGRDHFPSDLLVGAGIGTLLATAVHQYHAGLRQQSTSQHFHWLPFHDGIGLTMQWKF